MTLTLRPYQQEAITAIRRDWDAGLTDVLNMWYNFDCRDEQNTGALSFSIAAGFSQFRIVGKAPSMCGHSSLAARLDNGSARGGRFAMLTKTCTKCHEAKPLSEFYKNRSTKDGLDIRCKACAYTPRPRPKLPEGLKKCHDCKQIKSIAEFSKDRSSSDGYSGRCKPCASVWMKRYTLDGRMAQAKKKYRLTEKGMATETAWRNSESGKKSKRAQKEKYWASEHGKAVNRQYMQDAAEQYAARRAVRNAVRRGELPHVKTLTCVFCDQQAENYHHDKGYSQEHWLHVVPVCRKHHDGIHYGNS